MSKAILEFNLPEEEVELQMAMNAGNVQAAIWDVSQEVFRPARKHGYNDSQLQLLLTKLDEMVADVHAGYAAGDGVPPPGDDWPTDEYGPLNATDLIGLLEKRFYAILEHHGVQL